MRARNLANMPVSLIKERHGRFVVYLDSTTKNSELLGVLLPDPDRLFDTGVEIQSDWQSAATDKTVVNLGGKRYFLKRYNCLGVGYRLKNIFRNSRALKSWWAGWKFQELGLSTPTPIVCLEERHLSLLGRSYLLFEMIDNAASLLDSWPSFNDARRRDVLTFAGAKIGKMHRLGLLHGDLNWRNILVRESSSSREIDLVDLDGSRYVKKVTREQAQKDMSHFFRDLQRNQATELESELFSATWEKFFGAC